MTRPIITAAFKSDELRYSLEDVIAVDDGVAVNDIPDETVITEAHFVLGKFTGESGGFEQESDYNGDNGPEQRRWAKQEVKALRAFLKKYDPTNTGKPSYVR